MKHRLFLLLWFAALPVLLSAQPISGYCGREVVYNNDSTNLTWQVDTASRVLTIAGNGQMKDYSTDTRGPWWPWRNHIDRVDISNGVTVIGTFAFYQMLMDSVTWSNTLTTIRQDAFCQCTNIRHLVFPSSLTTIEAYVFSGCSGLKTLHTGDGLQTIGKYAFQNCGLESVDFENSPVNIGLYNFSNLSSLKTIRGNKIKSINSYSFENCSNLETIDFEDSPVDIGYENFYNSPSLKTIRGTRIKTIGSYAFYNCTSLESIQFGDSLTNISSRAFRNCNSLRSLHFPATLNSLSTESFTYALVLDTITVDPNNTVYNSNNGCNAVMKTSDNTLVLGCRQTVVPIYTTSITNHAFHGCRGLQSVTLPEGLTGIGSYAFYACSGLQSITLPDGLTSIGSDAFAYCSGLQNVVLPNSVTTVDCEAFHGCSSLTTPIYNNKLFARLPAGYAGDYTIPDGIETVCCGAFYGCKGLTSVVVSDSVYAINSDAFYDCSALTTVTFPDSLNSIGSYAFYGCSSLTSLIIPDRVNYINNYAFYNCTNLTSIVLPNRLISIGSYAFYYCKSLLSITIPDATTRIGESAFSNCQALSSITFPANMNSFGRSLLSGCANLATIVWNVKSTSFSTDDYWHPFSGIRGQITSFVFGDSVRTIPTRLCADMSNLTSISLGSNIATAGNECFQGCTRLSSIHWNARSFKDPSFYYKTPFYSLRDSITTFTFGDSVQHIPAYLCHGMSRLHELHIPENVSSIGEFAFRYLPALDSISVDPNNNHYDSRGGCNALIETSSDLLMLGCYKTRFPADISGVGPYAFRNVRNLTTATLPEGTTVIGKEAFNGCKDLQHLTLATTIETINDYAFQDCDSLYQVTLPDSLWYVGLRAFANCTHLQSITLPERTELLDQYAFSGCTGLQSITCNAVVPPDIQSTSFQGSSCPIYVPCPSITDYRTAPVWSDYGNRVVGQYDYKLSTRPNDYTFGRVNIIQQPDCEHNAILLAEPLMGHDFVSWQDTLGNVLSTDVQYEFRLDEDRSIVAHFIKNISALDDIAEHLHLWVQERTVFLSSDIPAEAVLYDLTGHSVDFVPLDAGVVGTLVAPTAGVYIVCAGNHQHKVIIK